MFKLRVAAAATVIALIAAFASAGSANAATGVGTTETSTSLVDVALGNVGSLLRLRVLGDDAKATVDPGVGPLSAFSQLFALKATSSVLPVLNNITIPSPPLESRTPGGAGSVTGPVINLANAVPSLPLLGTALASGSIAPVSLTSAIDNGVAKSGLGANLADINLVGGLLSVEAVNSIMGANAGAASAEGFRGLDVGAISVLNLGALLKGLGIDPATLPLGNISDLVSSLNLPIDDLPTGTALDDLVGSLLTTLSSLTGQTGAFNALPGGLQTTVNGALGGLGSVPALGSVLSGGAVIPATDVTSLLGTATGLLDGLLSDVLDAIDGIDLLKLNGLKIGTVTKAVTSTGDSKAEAVGTLGGISVGNLPVLGSLDLGAVLGTVNGLADTVMSTLDGVLGTLGLDGIVSVKLFDKSATNGVSNANGYTRALAGITGISIAITPPTELLNIVNGLVGGTAGSNATADSSDSIGSILDLNNGTAGVPVLGGLMGTLNGAQGLPVVGGVLGALAGGASIKVASVATGSNFAAPGVPVNGVTPVTQLPRTGANTTAFLVIGMLMIGGVLVARRYIPVRASIED